MQPKILFMNKINFLKKTLFFGLLGAISIFSFQLLAQSPTSQPAEAKTPTTPQVKPMYDDFGFYKKQGKASKAWNDFVKQGFDSYDSQDCEKSVTFLKEAVKNGCQDPIVFFKLAACSEVMGSYYSAAQYYKQAEDGLKLLRSPHRYQTDFYEAYGRTLYLNQRLDEAIPYLTKATETGTPSFFLYYLLGELLNSKGQAPAAIEYFNKALAQPLTQATPGQLTRIYKTIGKSYLDAKNYSKATEYLTKAADQSPNDQEIQQLKYRASEAKRQEDLFKSMDQMMNNLEPESKKPAPKPTL